MMNPSVCIIHSRDMTLIERLMGYWSDLANVRQTDATSRLYSLIRQLGACLVVIDLRQRESADLLRELLRQYPECVVTVVGEPGSEPLLAAEHEGAFDVESIHSDRRRFACFIRRALAHLQLKQQLRMVRDAPSFAAHAQPVLGLPNLESRSLLMPLRDLSRAFRHFQQLDTLYEYVVEGIAGALKLSRIGLFAVHPIHKDYGLRAGIRCLPDAWLLRYVDTDSLVQWMSNQGHLISRSVLEHVHSIEERYMLRQALSAMGAEVIMPIHANGHLTGWIFLGHRSSGYPFEPGDIDDLSLLAEHVSTIIENALLCQEITVQKMLADTLLDVVPTGIVAIDDDECVIRLNAAAMTILELDPQFDFLGQPIAALNGRLAHLLREAHRSRGQPTPQEWLDPTTQRVLSMETRQLLDGGRCLGAVAFIQDITRDRLLKERQEELDRTRFWADLAASMAHEIRNPLVSIKTFAQLFPESFGDPEFRERFSILVPAEVDRLDNIVTQIYAFSHPPELQFSPVEPVELIHAAIRQTLTTTSSTVKDIALDAPSRLPGLRADARLLQEAIAHLLRNAIEAVESMPKPAVSVSLTVKIENDGASNLIIYVRDNGHGFADDHLENAFSPFFTTKAQGMGLGLPIAHRTIMDHDGWIRIERLDPGARVIVTLPIRKGNQS